MESLLNNLFAIVITIFAGLFAWETTKMVNEKNEKKKSGDK